MGNEKNMKTMNTLSLIVTLTIFLANGSVSKNLNRKPTISAPHHPAPGANGTGINPNLKFVRHIAEEDDIAGKNGAGINPNSKISTDIKPEHAMPGANGTGINPNLTFKRHMVEEDAISGKNGAGINPNS